MPAYDAPCVAFFHDPPGSLAAMVVASRSAPAMIVCGALGACASGRIPSALVERPLSLPAGTHQAIVAGGPHLLHESKPIGGASLYLAYRYGLTDDIDYQFPARGAYRFLLGEDTELAVGGGVAGFGAQKITALKTGVARNHLLLVGVLCASVKTRFGSNIALVAVLNLLNTQDLSGNRHATSTNLGGTVVYTANQWLSIAGTAGMTVRYEYFGDQGHPVFGIGGPGSDGYAPVPTFAVHVIEWLDVIVAPSLSYDFQDSRTDIGVIAGIDLRL